MPHVLDGGGAAWWGTKPPTPNGNTAKLFENSDAPGPRFEKSGLRADDIVEGEAAAREAFPHEGLSPLRLRKGLLANPASLHGAGGQLDQEAGDLSITLQAQCRKVGLRRDTFSAARSTAPWLMS